ncbi:MAG: M6 family metalloprotease-like protein [Saprospiraceae bacterium]|jgi:M6 family metalloprotease-like protein
MKKNTLIFGILTLVNYSVLIGQTNMNIPIKGICIYIDYPDAPIDVSPTQLDSMLNHMDFQSPVINRSFRKYWHQETRRNFDVQHDIFYYTAPMPATFYEGLQWFDGIQLWRDALEWVIANNPNYNWNDLSKWSTTDPFNKERPTAFEGAIKSVMVISSVWGPAGVGAAHFPSWNLSNGETVGTIQGSILQAPWHSTVNLFVLFHESGHSLFNLPDIYDYDASSGGAAKYSLMSAQGPDVEPVGAPFLYQHNWGYVKEPEEGTHTFTLPADGDTIVVIKNIHDPKEFFALEIRKNSTLGNSLFPVPIGLLIWHSDLKVHTHNTLENATRYAHYKHSVVQKDGLFELENSGPNPPINAGDIYLPGDVFNDATTPNANWWSGESSGFEVKDILLIGDSLVQFTVVISEVHEEHYDLIPKDNWALISQAPSQFGFDGGKAFDDDLSTYYHVPFGSSEPRPHELVIDLGTDYEIAEFYYTANDNFSPPWEGRIKDYELHFSMNGVDWGTPIVAEQFFQTPYKQYALFSNEVTRYVKFSALNSYLDDERTSIAEIDFRGKESTVTYIKETDSGIVRLINFSPNPISDFLKIERLEKNGTIKIFSPIGSLLKEVKNADHSILINTGSYPTGILIVSVYDEFNRHISSKKILKIN